MKLERRKKLEHSIQNSTAVGKMRTPQERVERRELHTGATT